MDTVFDGIRFGVGIFIAFLIIIVIFALIVAIADEFNEIKRQRNGKGNNEKSKKRKH